LHHPTPSCRRPVKIASIEAFRHISTLHVPDLNHVPVLIEGFVPGSLEIQRCLKFRSLYQFSQIMSVNVSDSVLGRREVVTPGVLADAGFHSSFDCESGEIICPFDITISEQHASVLESHPRELLKFPSRFRRKLAKEGQTTV
jgi:hypothetical protein